MATRRTPAPDRTVPSSRLVALLRGINVGGQRLKMDALRQPFESLGCRAVSTVLASGNVLFEPPALLGSRAQLIAQLEAGCAQSFGFAAPMAVLDATQVDRVISAWPWPTDGEEASRQMAAVPVGPDATANVAAVASSLAPVLAKNWQPEAVICTSQAVYAWHPAGIHDSPLAKAMTRATRAHLTMRNLATWLKLQAALRT